MIVPLLLKTRITVAKIYRYREMFSKLIGRRPTVARRRFSAG
jgi:hypothetical protein